MPLDPPRLDTRTFEDILSEARLRIPRYTPDWTDFNDSDPGMTLVQLFAWLTEMMLYQMNRLPELNYIKFLQLLGMELEPAQPATAHLTFVPRAGGPGGSIPARTRVDAQSPASDRPVIFETTEGMDLISQPLVAVKVYSNGVFENVSDDNAGSGRPYPPLSWTPQPDSALYLGFDAQKPPANGRPFPQQMRFRVFLPPDPSPQPTVSCADLSTLPTPPVTLVWEYKPSATAPRWRALNVFKDESVAFTREGYIVVAGPPAIEPTREARLDTPCYWLRCRLAGGVYPAGQTPLIEFIRPNVVPVENLTTVREEFLAVGTGEPAQVVTVAHGPVQPDSLEVWIEGRAVPGELWTRRDDFLASGPDDAHYVLNATRGEIRFGDGDHGRIPAAGADITARQYRYGGGALGNVDAGLIATPRPRPPGVEQVLNERRAVGGRDEQSLDDLKQQAPTRLRNRDRAVTAEDFATLAQAVGGVAKATALSMTHPDYPGVAMPGAVTVVVVPDSDDLAPRPSADLKARVCQYLASRRLVGTEVHVADPAYVPITVRADVEVHSYVAFDAVAAAVIDALFVYLDPLGRRRAEPSGQRGPGWQFGQDFHPTNLYSVLLAVPDVVAVPNLRIMVDGQPSDVQNPVLTPPDGLICSGLDHHITVKMHQGQ